MNRKTRDRVADPAIAATTTVPTGFSGEPPPGPAMPVTATATSAPARARMPSTIASATGSLTAPCAAMRSGGHAQP